MQLQRSWGLRALCHFVMDGITLTQKQVQSQLPQLFKVEEACIAVEAARAPVESSVHSPSAADEMPTQKITVGLATLQHS